MGLQRWFFLTGPRPDIFNISKGDLITPNWMV
jgi:hypothetical protein